MVEIKKRRKAMSVSPLKSSQTMGATLAWLGFNRAMPLMHGSQGCTAFAKVFFVRHYREPVPLQTTAMDQVTSIMGADNNVVEALKVICEKQNPALIGLCTTGLAETQGCDINMAVGNFRRQYPQYDHIAVIPVNTPDFSGCFESGYALAIEGVIKTLFGESDRVGVRRKQVNVLCSAMLTPGDLEFITDSIESFGLRPLLIPNLATSMDGHLATEELNPLTTGGLTLDELDTAKESAATLVIGSSMAKAGELLSQRTGIPTTVFDHLHTLKAVDDWLMKLSELSGESVPARWRRQRRQLQDAMLDTHFMMGDLRVAVAADPDLLLAMQQLVHSMGGEVVSAVAPEKGNALSRLEIDSVTLGDLEDLENGAISEHADLLLGNSHLANSAERLQRPLLRVGFPQYDFVGGFQRTWCGYRGIQQALFDMANLKLSVHEEIKPYRSIYAQECKRKTWREAAGG